MRYAFCTITVLQKEVGVRDCQAGDISQRASTDVAQEGDPLEFQTTAHPLQEEE